MRRWRWRTMTRCPWFDHDVKPDPAVLGLKAGDIGTCRVCFHRYRMLSTSPYRLDREPGDDREVPQASPPILRFDGDDILLGQPAPLPSRASPSNDIPRSQEWLLGARRRSAPGRDRFGRARLTGRGSSKKMPAKKAPRKESAREGNVLAASGRTDAREEARGDESGTPRAGCDAVGHAPSCDPAGRFVPGRDRPPPPRCRSSRKRSSTSGRGPLTMQPMCGPGNRRRRNPQTYPCHASRAERALGHTATPRRSCQREARPEHPAREYDPRYPYAWALFW